MIFELLVVLQMSIGAPPPIAGGVVAAELHVRFWQGLEPHRAIAGELHVPLDRFTCQLPLTYYQALPLPLLPAAQWLAYQGPQTECRTSVAVAWPTLGGEVDARFVGGGVDGAWSALAPVRALRVAP